MVLVKMMAAVLLSNPAAAPVDELMRRDTLAGDVFGLRPALADRGIHIDATLTVDWSANLRGGIDTEGSTARHLLLVGLTAETEPLFDWPGGTFYIDFLQHSGPDASARDIGDFQAFSNVDADGRTQLNELWYEQFLFDERMRMKVGKVDVNADFAYTEHGGHFIHSSAGFSPTILNFPSYPDPATSLNLFLYPTDHLYLGAGIYDGAIQEGVLTGKVGPATSFGDPADLFLIGEVGVIWSLADARDGRFALGAWHHTGTFDRWDGGHDDGTAGLYIVIDQQLWREPGANDAQGIGAFFQFGFADDAVAEADMHIGAGVAWTGVIPSRDDDVIGAMVSYVHFSDDAQDAGAFGLSSETAIEWFYKAQLTPWLAVQPDLQYIIQPGGDPSLDDALVATLRVEMNF